MRFRPFLLLALLLAFALPASARYTHREELAAMPISRLDLPWWRSRHEQVLQRVHRGNVGLIWLGDSITQNWERDEPPPELYGFQPAWQRFYGDRDAVNMGFTGDTTASLLWRIENGEVDGIAPKAAVILIGANNFGHVHWSAAATVAGIDAIVAQLQKRLPRTKLLLLAVLPSIRDSWVSAQTSSVNRMLADEYGHGGLVTFVDETGLFLKNGAVDRDAFYDPRMVPPRNFALHPTARKQAELATAIEPALAGLMGDHVHR